LAASWSFQRPAAVSDGPEHAIRDAYGHGHQEVGRPLLEAAYLRHQQRSDVRYECLHNENEWDDSEVGQLIGRQLRGELGKDEARCEQLCVEIRQD
jgi:hypothetical protein